MTLITSKSTCDGCNKEYWCLVTPTLCWDCYKKTPDYTKWKDQIK